MTKESSRIPHEVKVIIGYDVLISALHTVGVLTEKNYLLAKIGFGIYLTYTAFKKGVL